MQARLLDPSLRGEFAEYILLFGWFFTLNSLIHPGTLHYTKYNSTESVEKYLSYIKYIFPIPVLCLIILYFYGKSSYFLLSIPYFFLHYFNEFMQVYLFRFGDIRSYFNNQIFYFSFLLILNLIALLIFKNIESLIISVLIAQSLFCYLNFLSTKKLYNSFANKKPVLQKFKLVLLDIFGNLKSYTYYIGKSLILSFDKFIIIYLFDQKEFGVYIVVMMFNTALLPFVGYLVPMYTKLIKEHGLQFTKSKSFMIRNCLFFIGSTALYFSSTYIVLNIFGNQYASGILLAKYVIIASFFQCYFSLINELLMIKMGGLIGTFLHLSYMFLILLITIIHFANSIEIKLEYFPLWQSFIYPALILIGAFYTIRTNKLKT